MVIRSHADERSPGEEMRKASTRWPVWCAGAALLLLGNFVPAHAQRWESLQACANQKQAQAEAAHRRLQSA